MIRLLTVAVGGAILAWVAVVGLMAGMDSWPSALAVSPPVFARTLAAQAVETDTLKSLVVVVQADDRRTIAREVTFSKPISGLAALLLTGLDVTTAETDFGPAVCAIEGIGCPSDDCFCDPDQFWNYSFWDDDGWQSYGVGASSSEISTTGAVEGWRWGTFEGIQAPARQSLAAMTALVWLQSQQDSATGGYGTGASAAVEIAMALGANDDSLDSWQPEPDGPSLADFLLRTSTRFSRNSAAAAGKLAVATAATDGCQTHRSLAPSAYFSATIGAYDPSSGPNAWGILGTLALSETVPDSAVESLLAQQQDDGGWEWQPGFGADTNSTALAVQALIAAGEPVTDTAVVNAVAFLASAQQEDGGFVYDPTNPGAGSDANSTAYVLQSLAAVGADANSAAWTTDEGATPISFLESLQQDDGALAWQPGGQANLLATAQAVPALLGQSYPIAIESLESCAALRFRAASRAAECAEAGKGSDCVPEQSQ